VFWLVCGLFGHVERGKLREDSGGNLYVSVWCVRCERWLEERQP